MSLRGMGIAWLREQDWPRWLELDPQFHPDYQHWLRRMQAAEARLTAAGIPHVRVLVTPDEFMWWADACGKDYSTVSRAEYAGLRAIRADQR